MTAGGDGGQSGIFNSGGSNMTVDATARATANAAAADTAKLKTNTFYLIGTGDQTTDDATWDAAHTAVAANTPTVFDFRGTTMKIGRKNFGLTKWVSLRNGTLEAAEPSGYTANWSSDLYGFIKWGDSDVSWIDPANGSSSSYGWVSFTGAADLAVGDSVMTNSAIATALDAAIAAATKPIVAVYLDIYTGVTNPNEGDGTGSVLTGGKYGQRIGINHVDTATGKIYFSEPLQTALPMSGSGERYRIRIFDHVITVEDMHFKTSYEDDFSGGDFESINMGQAMTFHRTAFALNRVTVDDMGLYKNVESPGTCDNCSAISRSYKRMLNQIVDIVSASSNVGFSGNTITLTSGTFTVPYIPGDSVTISGTAGSGANDGTRLVTASTSTTITVDGAAFTTQAAGAAAVTLKSVKANTYGPWGIYTYGFIADHFMRDTYLKGFRQNFDATNPYGTMVNHLMQRCKLSNTYQANVDTHPGGYVQISECEIRDTPGRLMDGNEQGISIYNRGRGILVRNSRIFHDKTGQWLPVAIASDCTGPVDIDGVVIVTNGEAFKGSGRIRRMKATLVREPVLAAGKFTDQTSLDPCRGRRAIVAANGTSLDIDDTVLENFAVGVSAQGYSGKVTIGDNVRGVNLLTESLTPAKDGLPGNITTWMTYDKESSSSKFNQNLCVKSVETYSNTGENYGLVFNMPSFPTLGTNNFTIMFRTKIDLRSKDLKSYMFHLISSTQTEDLDVLIGLSASNTWDALIAETGVPGGFTAYRSFSGISTTGLYGDGIEHHIAITFNRSTGTANFYIDGSDQGAPSSAGAMTSVNFTAKDAILFRAQRSTVIGQFYGTMRDFRVYLSALSSGQIGNIVSNTYDSTIPVPNYWLKMNEGRGKVLNDAIGGGEATLGTKAVFSGWWDEV